MKKCQCCGWEGSAEGTCPRCGEASWAETVDKSIPTESAVEPKNIPAKKKS